MLGNSKHNLINKNKGKIFLISIILGLFVFSFFPLKNVEAGVDPWGVLFVSQNVNTFIQAQKKNKLLAFNATFTIHTGDAKSPWIVSVSPTTRPEEVVVGGLTGTSTLKVIRCTGGECNATADFANNPPLMATTSVSTTLTCDATAGACYRPFDIAVEALSGDVMIANGNINNDGKIFYTMWNGSATSTSVYVFNSGSAVDTRFVRLVADKYTDRILLLVADANTDLFAAIWDGSAWGNLQTITPDLSTANQMPFDGAFETLSGNAIVAFGETTTADNNPYSYRTYTYGGGWSATSTVGTQTASCDAATSNSIGIWVELESEPTSDRIAGLFMGASSNTGATTPNQFPTIWKSDGSTEGFTFATGTACEEATESLVAKGGDVAWTGATSTPKAIFTLHPGSTGQRSYVWWRQTNGFVGKSNLSTAMGDDAETSFLRGAKNSEYVVSLSTNCDELLYFNQYYGNTGSWSTTGSRAVTVPPGTAGTCTAGDEEQAFSFSFIPYSPWTMNWRWYSGADNTDTPTTALANENATTTSAIDGYNATLRLRFAVKETTGNTATSTRKKLQFTTGNPYSFPLTTWTDVDNAAGAEIWRYFDCNSGTATCNDGGVVATNVLTGSTVKGWWNLSKNAAAGSGMTLTATTTLELEFPFEANSAATGTTYYFRMFDIEQNQPIFKLATTTGCVGSTACYYPALVTATSTYLQEAFRLFTNADSLDVGAPLAAQNATATLAVAGDAFRLRVLVHVGVAGIGVNRSTLKLQFARLGTGAGCAVAQDAYADVTTGTAIAFYDNPNGSVVDGATLTTNASDPDVAHTVVAQSYEELNNFTNPAGLPSGQDGKWDFALYDNGATGGETYCLRVVSTEPNSTNSYTIYPAVIIPAAAPALQQLHYRWRNDDGAESSASYSANEDTALSSGVYVGDSRRLRIQIKNTGAGTASSYLYKLEHSSSSCSVWVPVPNYGSAVNEHFEMALSSNVANNEATPNHLAGLTNPTGTYVSGFIKTSDNKTTAHTLTTGQYTELEYSVRSRSTVTVGTTYCFRVTNDGSTTGFTYTQTPSIVVAAVATRPTGGGSSGNSSAGGEVSGTGPVITGGSAGGGGGDAGGESGGSGTPQGGGGQGGGSAGGDSGYLEDSRKIFASILQTLDLGKALMAQINQLFR